MTHRNLKRPRKLNGCGGFSRGQQIPSLQQTRNYTETVAKDAELARYMMLPNEMFGNH
jgi:hypothetical protein